MSGRIRRIAVLTSGGDSPGYNPCIRAVVRMALHLGWEPWGVASGFAGLVGGEMRSLNSRSVSGIIGMGGTMLGSSRHEPFRTPQGVREALRHLNEYSIDALVVIGGDGSLCGARALSEAGVRTVGIPGTIENDVPGTDMALGVDTALNTALDALDRIKDTASAHQQAFLVEMMGEKCGYLTLMAGIAGGAEVICIPEVPFSLEGVVKEVANAYTRGKKHCIIVVAEGAQPHAAAIADYLAAQQAETGFGVRLSILGHIQRGGCPSAYDRFLGTRLGAAAVINLSEGRTGVMVGMVDGEVVVTELDKITAGQGQSPDRAYLDLAAALAQ